MNTEKPKFLMRSQVFKVVMMIHGDGNASNDFAIDYSCANNIDDGNSNNKHNNDDSKSNNQYKS